MLLQVTANWLLVAIAVATVIDTIAAVGGAAAAAGVCGASASHYLTHDPWQCRV